ncbi:hypothetical protein TNIN_346041 [Trichonephila inaurata madagascariensis]|uniref:Uncharacterized protein n=1 Tax=Trichonephila inaurata madagascariensis TaxID=2747483 RepID=A0A8X6Y644_9ARAC|nr:hypothetical protein TNIN_346041 [Trichonephila inaurata madagascariensis]
MAINKESSNEEQWGSRQTHIVILNMEGIILAVRLHRAGRSEERYLSKVEDSDIKRFRRLWWLCHTSSSLWCSSTCLLSFIPASVILLSDNEDFGGTLLPFLHHLCNCSPAVGVFLLRVPSCLWLCL